MEQLQACPETRTTEVVLFRTSIKIFITAEPFHRKT